MTVADCRASVSGQVVDIRMAEMHRDGLAEYRKLAL